MKSGQGETRIVARRAATWEHAKLEAAGKMVLDNFGPCMDPRQYRKCMEKFPDTLYLATQRDEVIGYADQFALSAAATKRLLSGRLEEKDITADQVLGDKEIERRVARGQGITLYMATICVKRAGTAEGHEAARALRECQRGVVQRMKDAGVPLRMLALAATGAGERFLERAGARLIKGGRTLKTGWDLYEIPAYPEEAELYGDSK